MADDTRQGSPTEDATATLADELRRLREAEAQHRRLAERLARSEAQCRAIAETARDSIFRKDRLRRYTYVNPAMVALLGRPAEEILGKTPEEVFGPEMGAIVREVDDIALGGEVADQSRRLILGGTTFTFHTVQAPIRDEAGEVVEIAGIVRDVTELALAQQALKESEERYRVLVEDSPLPILVHAAGRVVFVNHAACEALGAKHAAALVGRPWTDFVPAERRADVAARFEASYRDLGHSEPVSDTFLRLDAETLTVEGVTRTVRWEGLPAAQVVVMDVTARRRAEEQVQRLQRLQAIGTLAGGVAHDFNNLLTAILGYADDLKHLSAPGEPVHEAATVIEQAGLQAAELTRQLLGFARKGKVREEPVDVHEVLQKVIAVLARTVDRRIVISQRLDSLRPLVKGDPGQLQQVVLNLGVNARDAMPEGGSLIFETEVLLDGADKGAGTPATDCRPEARSTLWAETTRSSVRSVVRLRVRDTGRGISETARDRIFDPFFTTKPEGRGTGMGLAMVFGIVDNHGGTVRVESTSPEGTTFLVELPLMSPEARIPAASRRTDLIQGQGRILVVEDEEIIRKLLTRTLTNLGYEVLTAADGVAALDCYRAYGPGIDLVLMDLVMPRMNGRDCFAQLRLMDPDVRVILATGHGQDEDVKALLTSGVAGYLAKPFSAADLSQQIAAVLRSA